MLLLQPAVHLRINTLSWRYHIITNSMLDSRHCWSQHGHCTDIRTEGLYIACRDAHVGASAPSLPALQVVAVSKRVMPGFCPWRA